MTCPPVVPDDHALALILRHYADDFDPFEYGADGSDAPT